jgi:YegS/Rv2252/BmrU family lipid kinase
MKHLFIINPTAGKGKSLKLIPEIEKAFKSRKEQYIMEITERPGHATEIARRYVSTDDYRVYSVGGDGTLNEVLNGMAGSSSSLAVIPAGSGNDFIKSITTYDDIKKLLNQTIDGHEKNIDLGKVNDKYFINIASLGFDAEVVKNTNRVKKLPLISGSVAYVLGILITLYRNKKENLKISIDGNTFEQPSLLTAVANGKYYGGGMLAAPAADLNDGKFDIFVVKHLSRLKILELFPKFIKGEHTNLPYVSFFRGSKVEISCDGNISINIDGELGTVRRAVFEIIPNAVKIIVPAG